MAGLIPFNHKNNNLARTGTGFDDFYNMLDDFFNDGLTPSRNLLRDSFKLDIQENDNEYLIEAEMAGIKKDEIDLSIDDETLCITVNRSEETNKDNKNFVHRERRSSSMSRRVRLAEAKLDEIKAKLEDGILHIAASVNRLNATHWTVGARRTERMLRCKLYIEKIEKICYNKNAFVHTEDRSMRERKPSVV